MKFLTSPLLTALGVSHGFTGSVGGVSEGDCATLNLGLGRGDLPSNIAENRRRVLDALERPKARWLSSRQVHGTEVLCVDRDAPLEMAADGLVTRDPNVVLATLAADCVPLLFSSGDGKMVAAVHAGWKGTVGGVVVSAVAHFVNAGIDPDTLYVAIGPRIGVCCFEVGHDVATCIADACGSLAVQARSPKPHADLAQANRTLLVRAGVQDAHIWQSEACTVCCPGYFSHRALGERTGRQAGVIACR